jgi:tRNA(His) 5'-end guanylyltransferase
MANRNTLSLGDRMKKYENALDCKLNPCMQYMIRLDGKGFSKMIKKWQCEKPFDSRFNKAMTYATRKLFDLIPNVKCMWHGSDEISVWFECPNVADMYYDGRIQKLVSLASAQVSVYFNKKLQELFNDNELPFGIFDARVMQFPNDEEAINCLLFRQRDHIRNSISGYAQFYFSHKEIDKKNSDEKIEMMKAKGFDWNELDCSLNWSKFGTFLWKENVEVVPNGKESYIRTAILERSDNFDDCIKYIIDLKNNLGPMRGYPEEDWLAYKKENE